MINKAEISSQPPMNMQRLPQRLMRWMQLHGTILNVKFCRDAALPDKLCKCIHVVLSKANSTVITKKNYAKRSWLQCFGHVQSGPGYLAGGSKHIPSKWICWPPRLNWSCIYLDALCMSAQLLQANDRFDVCANRCWCPFRHVSQPFSTVSISVSSIIVWGERWEGWDNIRSVLTFTLTSFWSVVTVTPYLFPCVIICLFPPVGFCRIINADTWSVHN